MHVKIKSPQPKDNRSNQQNNTLVDQLLTVEEVAKFLRLREETIRTMARSKRIPALKIGRAWRFRVDDIRKILNNRN